MTSASVRDLPKGRERNPGELPIRLEKIGGADDLDVVVEGQGDVGHGDQHQQEVALFHGRGEDQEFPGEADGGGNPSEAEDPDHERHGEKRRAAVKPGQVLKLEIAPMPRYLSITRKQIKVMTR